MPFTSRVVGGGRVKWKLPFVVVVVWCLHYVVRCNPVNMSIKSICTNTIPLYSTLPFLSFFVIASVLAVN